MNISSASDEAAVLCFSKSWELKACNFGKQPFYSEMVCTAGALNNAPDVRCLYERTECFIVN
jgi:hypothetical protein